MEIKVVYLGGTRGLTGTSEESLTLEQSSVSGHEFLDVVFTKHPKLRDHASSIRIAVNYDFVELTAEIKDGAEVALVPPVQGGAPNYLVTEEALEPLDAWHAVANDRAGATVLFIGTVRNHSRGKDVEGLEYEAYVPMVEKTLGTIASACDTTHKREPDLHRTSLRQSQNWRRLRCYRLQRSSSCRSFRRLSSGD